MSFIANKEISLKYLKYRKKKSCGCEVCFNTPADLHHLEAIGMGNNRKKPTLKHFSVVDLCRLHHTEIHMMGQKEFEKKYNINLWKEIYKHLREIICKKVEL